MSYLVSLYNKGKSNYIISESKSAIVNLKNNLDYIDCKVYNSKGFLLESAVRMENGLIEKIKCYADGECREYLADLYAQLTGKTKKIEIGKVYTYKTNLQTERYKSYYNGTKVKILREFDKKPSLYDSRIKAYEAYFIDSTDKATIVVFSINLFKPTD